MDMISMIEPLYCMGTELGRDEIVNIHSVLVSYQTIQICIQIID